MKHFVTKFHRSSLREWKPNTIRERVRQGHSVIKLQPQAASANACKSLESRACSVRDISLILYVKRKYCVVFVRRGHADAEIEAVFAKYDLDGDRILDEEEQRKMQEDLEGQKVRVLVHFGLNSSTCLLFRVPSSHNALREFCTAEIEIVIQVCS